MALELKHPSEIFWRINEELKHIIQSLQNPNSNKPLDEAQAEAVAQLTKHQEELRKQLAGLEKSAEWSTLIIAFYGETGAGKSSIIETLRILLREPGKVAEQKAFRALQSKYGLSEGRFKILTEEIEQTEQTYKEITQRLTLTKQVHEQRHQDILKRIEILQSKILEHKSTASLWQRILHWFRKLPEEIEMAAAKQQLPEILTAQGNVIDSLLSEKAKTERHKQALFEQQQEYENQLAELSSLADGTIIGDGSSDFTRKTRRYDLELNGQKFALLDVPGIEGKEGLVLTEIEQALQRAHAVFYVTNQAAPPQTGDEQRQGTLEKIRTHLSAQTEVWALFNKKVVNPLAVSKAPLIKHDEQISLNGLDETMREHLGYRYRRIFCLSALPAFLASTDHFPPHSQNARRRNKFLGCFDTNTLLEISCMSAFIQLLSEQLLRNSSTRIKVANFNQAKNKVDESNEKLRNVEQAFSELANQLTLDGNSSCEQIRRSFSILKRRLKAVCDKMIEQQDSAIRKSIYERIKQNIGKDTFEAELRQSIKKNQGLLRKNLPDLLSKEVSAFQKNVDSILKRFEEYAQELAHTYGKLGRTRLDSDFEIKINMDSGINILGLLSGLVGLALAPFTSGASIWLVGAGALTALVSIGKTARSVLSNRYKRSRQRKAVEDNLSKLRKETQRKVHAALDESLLHMQATIELLERALNAPGQRAADNTQLLKHSTEKLDLLSRQISNTGSLS